MASLFREYVDRWKSCKMCLLCEKRKRVVIARGSIPADVLFIGEAPGDSEDVVGMPFVGPAGRLLEDIISDSLGDSTYAMTNLVCCIPKDAGSAKGEPPKEAILACRPRLLEFVKLCQPDVIVCVGQLAQRWVPEIGGIPQTAITHPAAILRMELAQKPLAVKRCVVAIRDAAEAYL
jgi:uracil-DNA glycosylase